MLLLVDFTLLLAGTHPEVDDGEASEQKAVSDGDQGSDAGGASALRVLMMIC